MVTFRAIRCLLLLADAFSTVHGAAVPLNTAASLQRLNRRYDDWPSQVAESVHNSSWPDFVNQTTRWSTYAAPTFNVVFVPQSEEDLAVGVSSIYTAFTANGAKAASSSIICRAIT